MWVPWNTASIPRRVGLGLIVAVVLLLGLSAAYTGLWLIIAQRIEDSVVLSAASARDQALEIAWQSIRVQGYPFRFRLELTGLRVREVAPSPGFEATAPELFGSAQPWNFRDWQLLAPGGLDAALRNAGVPLAKMSAPRATGAVSLRPDGDYSSEPANHVEVNLANGWLILPAQPPTSSERHLRFGADLQEVTSPIAPAPFSNTINSLAVGLTVFGAIPSGPAADAAHAWRQSGGTIKLDHFELYWDRVEITGSGTVALDPDLQPSGSLSATIKGYDQLMTALSVAGLLPADDLTPAKMALAMLGPAISTNFTIQNGDFYLGPAKLGKAPRITWK
jgi:hypothetical protein